MRLGETTPALRRILLTIELADGSGLAAGVDAISPTVLVALNSSTLVAAGGTFGHVTGETRQHYYEASLAEASIPGFLLVVVIHASIQTAIGWAPVGQIFALGETSSALLRLPLTIFDTGEPSALATGAAVGVASDLASSANGGAFATDPGSLVEIGHGAYYWQAPPAAAAVAGFVEVRFDPAGGGFAVCLSWISVDPPGAAVVPTAPTGPPPIAVTASARPYPVIDYITLALSRLPHQYRGPDRAHESNTQKVIRALLSPVPDLATAMMAVLLERSIDTAVGAQLSAIGKRVGRERQGVADDEIYRRYVRAQITANKSDGIIEDILTIADLVIDDVAATPVLDNTGAAAYVLRIDGVAVPDAVAAVLVALVIKATSGGVRAVVEYSTVAPGATFVFDTGPGFDVGVLSTGLDHV